MSKPQQTAMTTTAKPYTQTSYFYLLIAVVILGLPFLWLVALALPHFPISDEQKSTAFTLLFGGWIAAIKVVLAGNVGARGAVTVITHLKDAGLFAKLKPLTQFLAPLQESTVNPTSAAQDAALDNPLP